ncbi:hypothetical protein Tco_0930087 [Tanacetum coccineum]
MRKDKCSIDGLAGAELVLEAEEPLLPLAGAEEGSFIVIPFKVSALNVDFDFKIDLMVFDPEAVAEESKTTTEWSIVFLCDSFEGTSPVS